MLSTDYLEGQAEAHFDTRNINYSVADAPKTAPPAGRTSPENEAPKAPQKPETKSPDPAPKPDKPGAGDEADKAGKKKPGFVRRHPLTTVALIVALAVAGVAVYIYWDNASHFESTDDAFITARQFAIAPKITGYVNSVPVTDNQHVETGDVIATLDDRDYQASLDQSNAQVASSTANIANVEAQRDVQMAQIQASKAQVEQSKASLVFSQQQAARYDALAKKGAGSVQDAQQYSSQLAQQDAAVRSAEANEKVAEQQLESVKAQLANARANLSVSEAQREQATLNISYATIKATEPGRIVSLTAGRGEFAQPGTNLAIFVPDRIWVTANFKETQLASMRPNQPVDFSIDAYPGHEWRGHVASVQPGSGTAFSLLPAENATGNYVKIVQRVPVKVDIDNVESDAPLGPGMSVVPTVRVDPTPSLWERLQGKVRAWRAS